MKNTYLEGGRVCTAHGVRGILKLEHYCDSARVLSSQKRVYLKNRDGSFSERAVTSASVAGQFVLMGIEGVDSREAAIAMRGAIIYLAREDIPVKAGELLLVDMIGLPVVHAESGAVLGELSDISDVAGRRIYTVKTAKGDVLLPDVPEFIKEIDGERGMSVLPIPGFFDDDYEI